MLRKICAGTRAFLIQIPRSSQEHSNVTLWLEVGEKINNKEKCPFHMVKLPTALQVEQWSRGGQEDMLCNIASIEPHGFNLSWNLDKWLMNGWWLLFTLAISLLDFLKLPYLQAKRCKQSHGPRNTTSPLAKKVCDTAVVAISCATFCCCRLSPGRFEMRRQFPCSQQEQLNIMRVYALWNHFSLTLQENLALWWCKILFPLSFYNITKLTQLC